MYGRAEGKARGVQGRTEARTHRIAEAHVRYDPVTKERADLRAAKICAILAQVNGAKDVRVADFMFNVPRRRGKSNEDMKAIVRNQIKSIARRRKKK